MTVARNSGFEIFREWFLVCRKKAGVKAPAIPQRTGKADRIFELFRI